jgi:hypothetical protein
MVGTEAAGSDADVRSAMAAGSEATYGLQVAVATRLEALGSLRSGMSPTFAADVMYAMGSPFTHHLLRGVRSWTTEQYRSWLHSSLVRELLEP